MVWDTSLILPLGRTTVGLGSSPLHSTSGIAAYSISLKVLAEVMFQPNVVLATTGMSDMSWSSRTVLLLGHVDMPSGMS